MLLCGSDWDNVHGSSFIFPLNLGNWDAAPPAPHHAKAHPLVMQSTNPRPQAVGRIMETVANVSLVKIVVQDDPSSEDLGCCFRG